MSSAAELDIVIDRTVKLIDKVRDLAGAIDGWQTLASSANDEGVSLPLGHVVASLEPIRILALDLMEDATELYLDLRKEPGNDEAR